MPAARQPAARALPRPAASPSQEEEVAREAEDIATWGTDEPGEDGRGEDAGYARSPVRRGAAGGVVRMSVRSAPSAALLCRSARPSRSRGPLFQPFGPAAGG